ncbi:ATP-dependent DNA helicase sgs1 [Balamuthia mandrillaris]
MSKRDLAFLQSRGIPVAHLSAQLPYAETSKLFAAAHPTPYIMVLFLTPARAKYFAKIESSLDTLYHGKLGRVVFDEAQCASKWSSVFSADYREMRFFRRRYPNVPVLSLTSTASVLVQRDVKHSLGMKRWNQSM